MEELRAFLDKNFDGDIDNLKTSVEHSIHFFSTNTVFPQTESDHLKYQQSIDTLWELREFVNHARSLMSPPPAD